jgi:hypothetical protein
MRKVQLGADVQKAQTRFALINTAANQGRAPASLAEMRRLNKVQEALEVVSHEETLTVGEDRKVTQRVLNEDVTSLLLEDAEWDVLKGRFFGAGIEWMAAATRAIADAYDVVEGAEEATKAA